MVHAFPPLEELSILLEKEEKDEWINEEAVVREKGKKERGRDGDKKLRSHPGNRHGRPEPSWSFQTVMVLCALCSIVD